MDSYYVIVFQGSMVYSKRIIDKLVSKKINPIVKNENESARLAGFGMINEQRISVYVHKDELEISNKLIKNLRI